MRAAGSYNVFNGEEHLLASLQSVRRGLDHINLVVQRRSNWDEAASDELETVLSEAKARGLCDEIIAFEPDLSAAAQENEFHKRSLGLAAALAAGATHFMTLDCDEFYEPDAFDAAKAAIRANGWETTAVATYLHIKRPIWRSREPDTTCCAFLTAVDASSALSFRGDYPVLVDPTRRLHGERANFHMFPSDAIAMMHMNLVRKDGLASKLRNTSSAHATEFIEKVRACYRDWSFGQPLVFPNKPPLDIVAVPDMFGIDEPYAVLWPDQRKIFVT